MKEEAEDVMRGLKDELEAEFSGLKEELEDVEVAGLEP